MNASAGQDEARLRPSDRRVIVACLATTLLALFLHCLLEGVFHVSLVDAEDLGHSRHQCASRVVPVLGVCRHRTNQHSGQRHCSYEYSNQELLSVCHVSNTSSTC